MLWLGTTISVCVIVTVFFFVLNREFAKAEHTALDDKCKIRHQSVEVQLEQIKEILKELRQDMKSHLKERK
jgi:hypothetical protein